MKQAATEKMNKQAIIICSAFFISLNKLITVIVAVSSITIFKLDKKMGCISNLETKSRVL